MIPPASAPEFLAQHGWEGAEIRPLAGDASFRRYFRVQRGEQTGVLMDAPPPHEDPRPFVAVAEWLAEVGLSAPRILGQDLDRGLLLLDDLGDIRLRETLDAAPERETELYESPSTCSSTSIAAHPWRGSVCTVSTVAGRAPALSPMVTARRSASMWTPKLIPPRGGRAGAGRQ
jgi:aminoglycoside/choline kinase family phosphotransferase